MKIAGRNAIWMMAVLISFLLGVAVNGAQDQERRAHYAAPFGICPGILGCGPQAGFNSGITFRGITFGSKDNQGVFSFHGERDEVTKECVDVYWGGTAKGTITLQNGEAHVVPDMTFPSESLEEAVALLQSTDFLDRARGAWAIGEIGNNQGIMHVEQALSDPQDYVKKYARQSLLLLSKDKKGLWLEYSGTKKGSKMQVAISFLYSPSSATVREFSMEHSPVEGKGINIGWRPSNITAVDADGTFTCSGRTAGLARGQVLADGSAVGIFSEQFKVTTEGDSDSSQTETKWLAQIIGTAGEATRTASPPLLESRAPAVAQPALFAATDRKSTRLNSSHTDISRMPSPA